MNSALKCKAKVKIYCLQGRRQRGGQWCTAPPFEIGDPHFTFGPPVATYIQCYILKMWPPFWFLAPLMLNPGDGPDCLVLTG